MMAEVEGGEERSDLIDRPSGYQLLTPESWWWIPLDEDRLLRSVDRLVRHQVGLADDKAQLRREIRDLIVTQAVQARAVGGIDFWISLTTAGPLPLAASLVISMTPPASLEQPFTLDEEGLNALAASMNEDNDAPYMVEHLPVGPGLRRERASVAHIDDAEEDLETFHLDWMVPVPSGNGSMLFLAYSTPLPELAEGFADLFDAVTATLSWQ